MVNISNSDTQSISRLLDYLSCLYGSHGSTREANISRVAGLLYKKISIKLDLLAKTISMKDKAVKELVDYILFLVDKYSAETILSRNISERINNYYFDSVNVFGYINFTLNIENINELDESSDSRIARISNLNIHISAITHDVDGKEVIFSEEEINYIESKTVEIISNL